MEGTDSDSSWEEEIGDPEIDNLLKQLKENNYRCIIDETVKPPKNTKKIEKDSIEISINAGNQSDLNTAMPLQLTEGKKYSFIASCSKVDANVHRSLDEAEFKNVENNSFIYGSLQLESSSIVVDNVNSKFEVDKCCNNNLLPLDNSIGAVLSLPLESTVAENVVVENNSLENHDFSTSVSSCVVFEEIGISNNLENNLDENFGVLQESNPNNTCIVSNKPTSNVSTTEHHSVNVTDVNIETISQDLNNRKRSGLKPDNWKRNVNKKLRMEGKAYTGFSRVGNVVTNNTPRASRNLGNRCSSVACKNSGKRQCDKISESQRQLVFNQFWNDMSWEQRRVYVSNNVDVIMPKRRYTENEDSRRQCTFLYHIRVDNDRYPVCKYMFLSTLALGERSVREWINKSTNGMCDSHENSCVKHKKIENSKTSDVQVLNKFLDELPKVPSHYQRSNSSKLFIEQQVESLMQLYGIYCKKIEDDGRIPLSRTKFSALFYEKNLSLYTLKKDLCNVCSKYESGNLSELEYVEHQRKKNRARQEKENDKILAKEDKCIVLTMDLQALKLCPVIQANAYYFKTKLACHNFTVYNLMTNQCSCYWFSEIDTDLTASTFASIIIKYLKEKLLDVKNKNIILYSDGCTYQNRNVVLANAILDFVIEYECTIVQKFLEPGHTQMECDSVHSVIERKLRKRPIHLPSNYLTVTQEARKNPFPYESEWLSYDQFTDYSHSSSQRLRCIRPGTSKVFELRAIKYTPSGISYKIDFDEEWITLPQRMKNLDKNISWPKLNKKSRKITSTKYRHLQDLKQFLPQDCHSFYDNLEYE